MDGRAGVAELVDALVLGTSDESRGGSNPSARTRPLLSNSLGQTTQPAAVADGYRTEADMQITETSADGLKREFKVVVAASDIDAKIESKLQEVGKQVNLPGFRPGKVPRSTVWPSSARTASRSRARRP